LRWINPKHELPVIASAVLAGAVISAIALPPTMQALSVSQRVAIVVPVNFALPACAMAIGLVFPLKRSCLIGTVALFFAFWMVRALYRDPAIWAWTPKEVLSFTSPILVVSMLVSCIFSLVAAAGAKALGRQVGRPPEPWLCRACGYDLRGAAGATCPECGHLGGG